MKFLRFYIRVIDSLNDRIGMLVSWLTSVMVLVVCYDVFNRYMLKTSSIAVQETEWHLFAVIFLLGAAYTLNHERHVRVDVFYQRLSPKKKAVINLIGSVVFLIPFAFLVIWACRDFVANSFTIRESSPDPGGLPARYLLKAVIPLGFFLLILQALSLIFKSILVLSDREPAGQGTQDD